MSEDALYLAESAITACSASSAGKGARPCRGRSVSSPDDPSAITIAISPDEKAALLSSAWIHKVAAVDLDAAEKRSGVDVRLDAPEPTLLAC